MLADLAYWMDLVKDVAARQQLPEAWRSVMEFAERYAALRADIAYGGARTPSKVVTKLVEPVAKADEPPVDFASRKSRTRLHRLQN